MSEYYVKQMRFWKFFNLLFYYVNQAKIFGNLGNLNLAPITTVFCKLTEFQTAI